jgi:hypothetical protein
MLTHILALIVGFGSLAIYLAAFFFPEVHRKNDFIWSGVGLFYALVLWVFTPRIGGWFFLGQLAAVALLIWFGWQMFSLRRQVTPAMQQTPVPSAQAVKTNINEQASKLSLQERLSGLAGNIRSILPGQKQQVSSTQTATQATTTTSTTEETSAATIGKSLVDAIDDDAQTNSTEPTTTVSDTPVVIVDNTDTATTTETVPEPTPPEPPSQEIVEAAAEDADAEEKTIPPVAEIAPDAELAPPAEAPPEKIPPKDLPQG